MKKIELQDCRSEVQKFAVAMERVLRENDWKGGWRGDETDDAYMFDKLFEEFAEVCVSAKFRKFDKFECMEMFGYALHQAERSRDYKGELVDLANVAMMLYDRERECGKSEKG
jgi:hypothetical protein